MFQLKSTLVVDQATHAAEDDLRKKFQDMEIQLQLILNREIMVEQTFEHLKKQFAKPSDRINDMDRSIKGMKEAMTLFQKYQDDFGKKLKSDMEDLRQDVDQIKTQRKDDTDIVDSISKRQDVLEEHIKDQGEDNKTQIKVQREHIKDQGEQIKDNETQIKVQGEQIKVQGEQIKDNETQIKVQGEQIKVQGEQVKDNEKQIKVQGEEIRLMKLSFESAFPQYDTTTFIPPCVATPSDMDTNKTPTRKKDNDHLHAIGIPFPSPSVPTSTPISTLGKSQQDESGYCGTPQGDSSINGGRI